jgi:ABC-2 type transport system permease protein
MMSVVYIVPTFFTGIFGALLSNNAVDPIIHLLPTYYLADGIFNAMQARTTASGLTLDVAVAVGSTVALFIVAVWALRRQAAVTAAI